MSTCPSPTVRAARAPRPRAPRYRPHEAHARPHGPTRTSSTALRCCRSFEQRWRGAPSRVKLRGRMAWSAASLPAMFSAFAPPSGSSDDPASVSRQAQLSKRAPRWGADQSRFRIWLRGHAPNGVIRYPWSFRSEVSIVALWSESDRPHSVLEAQFQPFVEIGGAWM